MNKRNITLAIALAATILTGCGSDVAVFVPNDYKNILLPTGETQDQMKKFEEKSEGFYYTFAKDSEVTFEDIVVDNLVPTNWSVADCTDSRFECTFVATAKKTTLTADLVEGQIFTVTASDSPEGESSILFTPDENSPTALHKLNCNDVTGVDPESVDACFIVYPSQTEIPSGQLYSFSAPGIGYVVNDYSQPCDDTVVGGLANQLCGITVIESAISVDTTYASIPWAQYFHEIPFQDPTTYRNIMVNQPTYQMTSVVKEDVTTLDAVSDDNNVTNDFNGIHYLSFLNTLKARVNSDTNYSYLGALESVLYLELSAERKTFGSDQVTLATAQFPYALQTLHLNTAPGIPVDELKGFTTFNGISKLDKLLEIKAYGANIMDLLDWSVFPALQYVYLEGEITSNSFTNLMSRPGLSIDLDLTNGVSAAVAGDSSFACLSVVGMNTADAKTIVEAKLASSDWKLGVSDDVKADVLAEFPDVASNLVANCQ